MCWKSSFPVFCSVGSTLSWTLPSPAPPEAAEKHFIAPDLLLIAVDTIDEGASFRNDEANIAQEFSDDF